jgi:hypothetical protein
MKITEHHWRKDIVHRDAESAIKSVVDGYHSDDQIARVNERIDNVARVLAAIVDSMPLSDQANVLREIGMDVEL